MLTALVLVCGCASVASSVKSTEWTGRRIDEAIKAFGTPSHVTPGEDGQKTCVWMLHRSVPEQTVSLDSSGVPRTTTYWRDSVHTYSFVVRADGTIVAWTHSQS